MSSHHPPIEKSRSGILLRWAHALPFTIFVFFAAGCGQTGSPLAPSLHLPIPVTDLAASRMADHVTLTWTMPRRTTDKLVLKGPQPAHICRHTGTGPCIAVADLSFSAEKPATYEDLLPAALTQGAPRLLSYSIQVRSPHGRSAGDSNLAYAAAGAAPPPLANAHGEVQAGGVLLQWDSASSPGDQHQLSVERTLLSISGSKARPASPWGNPAAPPVKDQSLIVHLPPGPDPGKARDADAAFDQRYSYRLTRRSSVKLEGKPVDMTGPPSPAFIVDTRDIFPPATPLNLAAVASQDEGAIDLSWSPDTDSDLAGYAIYRRRTGTSWQRLALPGSPAAGVIETPAFHDPTPQRGEEYTYAVTAIDRDGNESSKSAGISEIVPAKP